VLPIPNSRLGDTDHRGNFHLKAPKVKPPLTNVIPDLR
jgi:hypothetical protein